MVSGSGSDESCGHFTECCLPRLQYDSFSSGSSSDETTKKSGGDKKRKQEQKKLFREFLKFLEERAQKEGDKNCKDNKQRGRKSNLVPDTNKEKDKRTEPIPETKDKDGIGDSQDRPVQSQAKTAPEQHNEKNKKSPSPDRKDEKPDKGSKRKRCSRKKKKKKSGKEDNDIPENLPKKSSQPNAREEPKPTEDNKHTPPREASPRTSQSSVTPKNEQAKGDSDGTPRKTDQGGGIFGFFRRSPKEEKPSNQTEDENNKGKTGEESVPDISKPSRESNDKREEPKTEEKIKKSSQNPGFFSRWFNKKSPSDHSEMPHEEKKDLGSEDKPAADSAPNLVTGDTEPEKKENFCAPCKDWCGKERSKVSIGEPNIAPDEEPEKELDQWNEGDTKGSTGRNVGKGDLDSEQEPEKEHRDEPKEEKGKDATPEKRKKGSRCSRKKKAQKG